MPQNKELHIAPMLHVSHAEFRYFFRLLTKRAVLWTEMVVDETLVYSTQDNLGPPPVSPMVCQLGGVDPALTAKATKLVVKHGYEEINLNMDCPSLRVSGRNFGAILMKDVNRAVALLQAMKDNAPRISCKCRVGIDDLDSLEFMVPVISQLSTVCQRFVLHARKCHLQGLSPKDNRLIPPLNYPRVYELCRKFPHCQFWINGGISGLKAALDLLQGRSDDDDIHQVPCRICNLPNGSCIAPPPQPVPPNLQGVMLGRAAMDHPAQFWDVDRYFYGSDCNPCQNRRQLLTAYAEYLEQVYPRRCCDDNDCITNRLPAPTVIHTRPYCSYCQPHDSKENDHDNNNHSTATTNNKPKISTCVIDRSFKPLLGIFFGLKGSKPFRRACFDVCQDLTIRNCGPAFLLRKALQVVPDELLDQPFVLTEDLKEGDVPVHVSPLDCIHCGS
jgi:tRNA-dihydrouridine synthase A